jgi:gliding motility-associated-like protein
MHCNRKDTWIVTYANGAMYSFLVTSSGVNRIPVISPIPANIITPKIYSGGNIKFSSNSEKMVMPLLEENKMVVFNFDNLTGKFSNPIKLGLSEGYFITDVDLSVNGNNLYFTQMTFEDESLGIELHSVGQMNLKLGNSRDIQNSYYGFNDSYPSRTGWCTPHNCYLITPSLQMGPDGRIYISMREITGTTREKTVSVIEAPNEVGVNARFTRDLLSIGMQYKSIRYNYIRSTSIEPKENAVIFRKNNCSDLPVSFSLLSSKVDSVRWDFGDMASGSANFSKDKNPQHIYSAPGIYKIHAIIYDRCAIDTVNTELTLSADKSVRVPDFVKDSIICTGDTLFMDATTPNATEYLWGGGNTTAIQPITVNGVYEIQASNICSIDRKQFKVTINDCECEVFIPNAFTPNYDGLNDYFRPIIKCHALDFNFTVFNRYGQKIFQTNSYTGKGWNGKQGNEPASIGTYLWTLQYINPNSKKLIKQNGKLVLIR